MKKKSNNLIKILLFISLFSGCSHPSENTSSINTNSISSSNDLIEESVSSFDSISSIESSIVESSSSPVFVESSSVVESSSDNISTSLSNESLSSTITSSEVIISENTSSINSSFESISSSIKTDVDFSNLTYSALGDSITYGADSTKGYSPMDDTYVELVTATLSLKSFKNYARSGATIATDVDDLPSIYNQCLDSSSGANIISVMGGVNDYNRSVELGSINDITTNTFYGSLMAICELLQDKYSNAFIFFMTPYKESPYHNSTYEKVNKVGYVLEDYANAIINVCRVYNIPVLDMFNYGNFELEMYEETSDGIHPSQEFVKNYTSPQISQFIKENYKVK